MTESWKALLDVPPQEAYARWCDLIEHATAIAAFDTNPRASLIRVPDIKHDLKAIEGAIGVLMEMHDSLAKLRDDLKPTRAKRQTRKAAAVEAIPEGLHAWRA